MAKVTIKTIANDLGISHMTVSRALSDHPNVQKATRDAVLKRAHELGYVKNAAAMVMRGDAPRIVGLLLPNIVNEFYARFANDLATRCNAQSMQLIIHLTDDCAETEQQALDRLKEVQAKTVVLVPAASRAPDTKIHYGNMRVIELIRESGAPDIHGAVVVDDGPAIRGALRHLARQGHQNIAFIGADQKMSSGRDRLKAFQAGAKAAGVAINPALIVTGMPSFEMGRAKCQAVLSHGVATALVCGGVEISNGALSAIMQARAKGGRTLAFVGYGDPSFHVWVDGGVSAIDVPVTALAQRAAELIAPPRATTAPVKIRLSAELRLR